MQEFILTNKSKRRARKIRQRKEKKWFIFKPISVILFLACISSLLIGAFLISNEKYGMLEAFRISFAASLIGLTVTRAVLTNLTSHWIQDRLNERIWTQDGHLYHFVQTAFAAGLNSRNADERAYIFDIDINSIREAKYDKESKRIEFRADGKGIHFADYYKKQIDKEWDLRGYKAIFYDCTEPSLYEFLKSAMVQFEVTTIDFNIKNNSL